MKGKTVIGQHPDHAHDDQADDKRERKLSGVPQTSRLHRGDDRARARAHPVWLVVLSLGLHGFGYAFVLVVQQLYVDRVSPGDIRASAQSLLTIMTLGVGNVIGALLSGIVQQHYTHVVMVHGVKTPVTDWAPVFILPAATTLICALAYMFTFQDSDIAAFQHKPLGGTSAPGVPLK